MRTPLHEKFSCFHVVPREDLSRDIVRMIEMREARNCQIKLWGFIALGTISLIGIVPAVTSLGHELGQSGFYQYMSIAFSDPGTVSDYWKQFFATIAEALPVVSIAIVLGTLFVLGWSARSALRQTRRLSAIHIHS